MVNTMQDSFYVGTKLKFAIGLSATGFSMITDDYNLVLSCGSKVVNVKKNDIVEGENNVHYLLVDTRQFPSGTLKLIGYPEVPDQTFPDGSRTEVGVLELCILKQPY